MKSQRGEVWYAGYAVILGHHLGAGAWHSWTCLSPGHWAPPPPWAGWLQLLGKQSSEKHKYSGVRHCQKLASMWRKLGLDYGELTQLLSAVLWKPRTFANVLTLFNVSYSDLWYFDLFPSWAFYSPWFLPLLLSASLSGLSNCGGVFFLSLFFLMVWNLCT
jgi:hypothetical protein